ncbi:TetR/AcrR family transcriptional regulator [Actinomadura madurae]|uniref:TetR/AcrR family transcriptional regulator n=1 Tax=Actinomadura madurae TaxID=1993 RepID=UPI002025B677|nr:TetR/AcrR family transcriptional regulator [Actinomadura madurae]URM93931.1 TetR/AcrR family transcriptional regulator [Actinomadura madurae]URN04655.1 TetR/AcrR family transcriptional regulator [Actinomadura madurae]
MSLPAEAAESPDPAVRVAVERALSKRRGDAQREVEDILDATLRVAARAAPNAPRVADIVAEAGTSNQAFYRYFSGKDEVLRAALERGTDRVYGFLAHKVAKASGPAERIEAWVRGVLAQVIDDTAARQSRAVVSNLGERAVAEAGAGGLGKVRDLLREAVRAAGSRQVDLDTDAVFDLTFAVLRRHSQDGTAPTPAECGHLVRFCLAAIGVAATG